MKKIFIISFFLVSLFLFTGCVQSQDSQTDSSATNTDRVTETDMINSTPQPNKTILMKTNQGDIKIELYNSTKPITANNFLKLAEQDFYDGVIFHRVIKDFMIQGGDPDGNGTGGPGYSIPDELDGDNENNRGTLSMANSGPDTGGSQFFINVVDNNFLDTKHAVFGKVVEGMDIVDKIVVVETDAMDRPLEEVKIEDIEIL